MAVSRIRWQWALATAGIALVMLLLVVWTVGLEAPREAVPVSPLPSPPADPPVARVEGQPIARSVWVEAVLLDQALSRLAGVPAPTPEQTLDRLINETLVLRAAPSGQTPGRDEVEAQIAALEQAWGVSDAEVVAALGEVGLTRESLERAVARLLAVQRAQEVLERSGTPIQEWLARERARAQVAIYREPMRVPFGPPSPEASPSATLPPAPDFTLEQAGGGTLTLSDLWEQKAVVLVFFQRCG